MPSEPDDAARNEQQSRMRSTGGLAQFGGWWITLSTGTVRWSDQLALMLGYPAGHSPSLEDALSLHPPEDSALLAEAVQACAEHGTPFDQQRRIYTRTGELRDIRVIGEAARDESGTIVLVNGAYFDITDDIAEIAARQEMERRLTTTLDSISDGIITLDDQWSFTYVNPTVTNLLNLSRDDLLGKNFFEMFSTSVGTQFAIGFKRALTEQTTVTILGFIERAHLWIEATAYPVTDGLAIYVRDVTEREKVRARLVESEQRNASQAALLDIATDAIVVRELDDTIDFWNRAAEEMYGWRAEEVIGKSKRDLLYADPTAFDAATAILMRDGSWAGEMEHCHRNGNRIVVESSWTLVRDDDGKPVAVLSVNTDVTARRRLEEQNYRAQRMESIGTLASGIAHDLNNVLTPILISVQLLERGETSESRRRILSTVESSVKRGADMIRQVLSFAKGVDGKRIPVDVDVLLDDLRKFFFDTIPVNVNLEVKQTEALWNTRGDTTQLLQVLVNLITNATDAMPGGGKITVWARNVVLTDEYNSVSHLAAPGRYVVIDVEDTGEGMTPEVLTKIFEPFFTTKSSGHGTGLGLATSLGIVRSHGGYMQAYSEPGRGSHFQIHLPAIPVGTESDHALGNLGNPNDAELMPRGNHEVVLVVDDEASIRQITRQSLEAYGYRTLVASNGAEAIEVVESGGLAVDLILTDMTMPVMDGATAAAYFLHTHPSIPIIAASGLNANGGVARAAHSGVTNFLAKPYTTSELLSAVRSALDADLPQPTSNEEPHERT